jgi:hypothetical protein
MKVANPYGFLLVLLLFLTLGAVASPFNTFLRFKYFGDGYRWNGFKRRDAIPLLKTGMFAGALLSGGIYAGLGWFHQLGLLANMSFGVFAGGIIGTVVFSVCSSIWQARHARKRRRQDVIHSRSEPK